MPPTKAGRSWSGLASSAWPSRRRTSGLRPGRHPPGNHAMAWTLTHEIADYQAAAGGLLSADPVRNTVLLSVLASLVSLGPTAFGPQPPLFGWYAEDTPRRMVSAAVLQTPPHPL